MGSRSIEVGLLLLATIIVAPAACAQEGIDGRKVADLSRAFKAIRGLSDRCVPSPANWHEVTQTFFSKARVFQLTCVQEHGDSSTGYAAIEDGGNTYPLGEPLALRFLAFGTYSQPIDSSKVLDYLHLVLPLAGYVKAPFTFVRSRADLPPLAGDSVWAKVKLPRLVHEPSGRWSVDLTLVESHRVVRVKVQVIAAGKGEIELVDAWPIWIDPNLP